MSSVLIVDDSSADRALFRTILTRVGYTVHEVAKGREAVAKAREVRPHAIILDVNLVDTDGHTVCRALRADPEVASVPVLMLTVRDNQDDVLAGLEAGADDYVAKDAPPEIVLARVRRLVQYRQMAMVAVLNEQLVQVGRLLAGIVHEIRGPLAVIRGSAELMRLQLSADDPHLQWIEPILRNAQLLQVRLEHLMATVRRGPAKDEVLDVAPLAREAADLFIKGTDPRGHQVSIEVNCEPDLPKVRADPGRLIQVFLNLLGNAHEAITDARSRGRIAMRGFAYRDLDREWVKIEVADDGPGIPEDYLERIFEPFFTTKEKGSGYGLYLACEILREQGGRLTVNNRPGGGACFTVWLAPAPTATPEPESTPAPGPTPEGQAG
jgi:signal transduction histidine kinase